MNKNLPAHIGFIMDGNGRWAKKRGLTRSMGHRAGVKALKKIVKACVELEIPCITVFAFSTENWSRPKKEVDGIFNMVVEYNESDLKSVMENDIKLNFIGFLDKLDKRVQDSIKQVHEKTKNNKGLILNIALNYGGREDILQAVNKAVKIGKELTRSEFENLLLTQGLVMPDLIVRSSGEMRISNFLLYQSAYSEFVFTKTLWPDFDKEILLDILDEYLHRNRRFGGTDDK